MGERDKKELQDYYAQVFPTEKKLNIRCSSCVIRALKRLSNNVFQKENKADVTGYENLLMPELREIAKELGIKIPRSKVDLIYNIENDVKK
jgi:hypothetical protein